MKRYTLVWDASDGWLLDDSHPEGEWVRYDDANAWWQEVKELPRVQDVARIYELEQEVERRRGAYETECKASDIARAEVERLRAELAEVRASCDKAMDEQHANLVRVADEKRAANALLPKTWEAMGELTSVLMDGEHMLKVDDVRGVFESACAHLAAQSATAPARTEPVFGSSPVGGANLCPEHRPSVGEFLAAQHATTKQTDPNELWQWPDGRVESANQRNARLAAQPATAQTKTEGEQ